MIVPATGTYVKRLENFFLANDIDDDEKKRAVFISIIGPSMYKTLRNLVTPAKPADKTLTKLVKVLLTHLKPKPSEWSASSSRADLVNRANL